MAPLQLLKLHNYLNWLYKDVARDLYSVKRYSNHKKKQISPLKKSSLNYHVAQNPFFPLQMHPWHVSATSPATVLITNQGEKFQSRWEVADLSTVITSSKSNHDDEN